MGASFKHEYMASVFASNDLFRSVVASVFPLFANPLFNNLATHEFPIGCGVKCIRVYCCWYDFNPSVI